MVYIKTTVYWNPHAEIVPMLSSDFLDENEKWIWKKKEVESIFFFLFDTDGNMYLWKRSDTRSHNAWLYDKTVGYFERIWLTHDENCVRWVLSEIWVPLILSWSIDSFWRDISSYSKHLNRYAHGVNLTTDRDAFPALMHDWNNVTHAVKYHIYVWVTTMSSDSFFLNEKDVSHFKKIWFEEIIALIEENPTEYTFDIHFLLKKHASLFRSFLNVIK